MIIKTEYYLQGWASYFENEISSFLDVPLEWALNTEVPHWLLGSYVSFLKIYFLII